MDPQQNILNSFNQNQYLVSIFFDIEKAYDSAWKYGILKKLSNIGIKGNILQFINNFLNNRSIQVRIGSTLSSQYMLTNGVPQGSILSVYCFLLLINDIVHVIPAPIQSRLFADDVNITLQASNLKFAEKLLQICLNNLQEWTETNGLRFSSSKTKYIIFSHKHNIQQLNLVLKNTPLQMVNEAKFLGLVFDKKLSWNHTFFN